MSGSAAIAILLVAGFLFREDIRWWWRMRGVVKVVVVDYLLGNHVIEGPGPVAGARRATRAFLQSLPEEASSGIVGYWSEVVFLPSGDAGNIAFRVRLNHFIDTEHGMIECKGTLYPCKLIDWFRYLRDVLRPLAGDLVATWRSPGGDPKGRIGTAAALALLAPETEGVAEILRASVEKEPSTLGVWLLGEMGPKAASAAPVLEALMADHRSHEEVRNAAREALTRIRGE